MISRFGMLIAVAGIATPIALGMGALLVAAPVPATTEVDGVSGNAGEWEVTAKLTRVGETRDLAGPMKMTHRGMCVQDGPQEKSGEMLVRMARFTSSIEARVVVDGADCTFSGSLTDAYEGRLACPDRRPVQMILWLR